jgi:Na+/proline symporter
VNVIFVSLGALIYIYANSRGIEIPKKTDALLPLLTFNYLGLFAAIVFILGIIAATFSSADSVLTTLTTSLYIDVLKLDSSTKVSDKQKINYRHYIHAFFAASLFLLIMLFEIINDQSVISGIFVAAGYTYGPLLGLFAFGIYTKKQVINKLVPVVCILSPVICWLLSRYSKELFNGYQIGFELLIMNGLLTFLGLMLISKENKHYVI